MKIITKLGRLLRKEMADYFDGTCEGISWYNCPCCGADGVIREEFYNKYCPGCGREWKKCLSCYPQIEALQEQLVKEANK